MYFIFSFLKCILNWIGWGLHLGYTSILINGLQIVEHDNNATQKTEKDFELKTEEIAWFGMINLLSVTLGCVSSGLLMDPIGKWRLMQVYSCHYAWQIHYAHTIIRINNEQQSLTLIYIIFLENLKNTFNNNNNCRFGIFGCWLHGRYSILYQTALKFILDYQ